MKIHQNLSISGTGPLVENFDNRIEITNAGMEKKKIAVPEKANFAISVTLDGIVISVSP